MISRTYIFILLGLVSAISILYFVVEKQSRKIEVQSRAIAISEIEQNTSCIAAKAIGEIKQIQRSTNVKKPNAIGSHTAIF